jgi:hypothetical protein
MDMMAMVSAMMAMQAGSFRQQVATSVLKSNLDSQSSVLQLLAPASPAANNAAGIGGNVDISA